MKNNALLTFLLISVLCLSYNTNAQVYDLKLSNNTNSTSDEGEAHIAMNPTDSLKMVTGFMQLGNSLEFAIYHTSNGGNSWTSSTLNTTAITSQDFPGYSILGGGDVIFAYDKSGDLYCSWIYLLADLNSYSGFDSALFIGYWAKSIDNGATFTLSSGSDRFFGEGKLSLITGTIHNYKDGICDRQWMAVDMTNGPNQDKLYVGYINYPSNMGTTGLKVKTKTATQTAFSPEVTAFAGSGQLTNIAVDTSGVLHYSFCDLSNNNVYHVSSTNGGQSFSAPNLVYNGSNLFPNNGTINDRENAAPSLAIDGDNNLHLVWGDFPSGQRFESYYAKSTNGGTTWSTAQSLNTYFNSDTYMPVVSANNDHVTIGGNVLDANNRSEYYVVSSPDNGNTFGTAAKVSSGITDFNAVGTAAFIGDYSSSVRTNCIIYSLWTDCRNNSTTGCKQYIAKYDECLATGVVELTPIKSSFTLENIYPIPTKEQLNLKINSDKTDRLVLEIYNSLGAKVREEAISIQLGSNQFTLNVDELASGNYIIRLTNQEETFITKSFVKD